METSPDTFGDPFDATAGYLSDTFENRADATVGEIFDFGI